MPDTSVNETEALCLNSIVSRQSYHDEQLTRHCSKRTVDKITEFKMLFFENVVFFMVFVAEIILWTGAWNLHSRFGVYVFIKPFAGSPFEQTAKRRFTMLRLDYIGSEYFPKSSVFNEIACLGALQTRFIIYYYYCY